MEIINLESLGGGKVLDAQARAALSTALKAARRSGDAILLSGSAGAWNHVFQAGDAKNAHREFHSLVLSLVSHPAPVIAALDGQVNGLGLALAAAADVRVARAESTFQVAHDRGTTALTTGSYRLLTRLLGRARAEDLVYTAKVLCADDAVAMGLVSYVVAASGDAEALGIELSCPAASAVKRAATSACVSELTEELSFDAWLALTAAGETL